MPAERCDKCDGKGRAGPCPYCGGAGGRMENVGGTLQWHECRACDGKGEGTCDRCGGSGTVYT